MERKVPGRRYMDTDWEFNWEGMLDFSHRHGRRFHFFRVVSHPLKPGEDWGGCTWGNSGAYDYQGVNYGIGGCDDEQERRHAIAAKCWAIIDTEPGITFEMVQEELRKIDLELVRTARVAREPKPEEQESEHELV